MPCNETRPPPSLDLRSNGTKLGLLVNTALYNMYTYYFPPETCTKISDWPKLVSATCVRFVRLWVHPAPACLAS